MNLGSSKNFTTESSRARRAAMATALALLGVALLMPSGCRSSRETTDAERKPMTNTSGTTSTGNDPLAIHRRAIVIDMHADTTQRLVDEQVDLAQRLSDGHLDAVRAKEGGLDAQFFSIWVEPELFGGGGERAVKRADIQIEAVRALAAKHPETWELATTAADVRRIASSGKIAALMGMEGGYAIDEQIENVGRYYQMGVRYMSGAWSVSTSWAGSSGDEAGKTRGLNDFGKQVIREMNRLGMMVDVSHLSDKAFWDIVNTSTKPVIATHSGCRAITDVPRNLTDEMIVALAKTGGVVNVIFYPDHIDHVVKLVGVDHVGIGSDFDGIQAVPADLTSVADLPNLTAELLKRGYSESDIDKILGGNMLRVMEANESLIH